MNIEILQANRVSSDSIPSICVTEVTPGIARDWLARNIGNRAASPAHIEKLEDAIRAGKWRMTGDPIRFSKTGKLIDGQHRLQAILNSGMTVQCVVMRDLADDIFDVIDSGKSRGKTDVLFIELGLPMEVCKVLSSSVGAAIDYERQQYGFGGKADKSDLLEFVTANPSIIQSAVYGQKLPHQTPVPKSIAAFFHFYASKRNQVDAERFIERFMVGAVEGPNDNLLHLRNLCMNGRANRRLVGRAEVIYRMIRIWNAEQRGAPIKYFNNTSIRKEDAFPLFV